MRNAITLACTDCKQRNYQTNKNKKNNSLQEEKKANRLIKNICIVLVILAVLMIALALYNS